ncbi:universal stress protein [Kitasatospora sp. DSM 101779]|uniref:universal stress protein n=1 Tax=Kitasatospora sp. DSM 101779 TaxID=2853165 RepID=UPI0021DA1415|nr:universal stress protein [Kitasatospora sp. DSM 101779]MCU7820771.1 universal stress protein [Kitasatospora sp. DSM 101779]
MTNTVLTGIDGSPQSEAAALWAAEEAERRGAALEVLHVRPWLAPEDTGRARHEDLRPAALAALAELADRIRQLHPELPVEARTVGADPVDGLVAAAKGKDVVVLGSRGLGGFAGLLVGSVGLAVAARVEVPLVLVRADGGTSDSGRGARREVLVGVDADRPADAVLEFAFAEAARRGARLRAVHAWDLVPVWAAAGWVPPQVDLARQEPAEQAALAAALAPARAAHPEVEVVAETRIGGAAAALVGASAGAELVVLGRRDNRLRLGMRLGPVLHAVVHHATAPVAVVPHP